MSMEMQKNTNQWFRGFSTLQK